jgi:hypothetical protein
MTTPSRGDRHTARLARLLGAVVVVIAVVQALTLPALFRVQLPDRQRPRRR